MAIIYSYPLKNNPTMADLLVISDKETNDPKNQTKNVTIQSIVDLIPYIYAENAWNTISFPGVAGTPADVQAFGVNQTLNLTTGSLVITTIPSAGPGLPSSINIESPPGDGNIADRNLTFNGNWRSDLNGFTWDLNDESGLVPENVMHFENNLIGIGGGSSVWDIPINANNLGENNIYLGGDGGAGVSNHEFVHFSIGIGKFALENAGTIDYAGSGGTNNNNECVAIGYQSQKEFGTAALPGAGLLDQLGQNVSVGYNSLKDNTGNIDGINLGSFNVAIGGRSLEAANGATANMSIGHNSALALTTAFGNVLSGHEVGLEHFVNGYPTQENLTDGSNNVISGYISNTENGNKDVIIGSNASVGKGVNSGGVTNADNTIMIGTDSFIPASQAIIIGNDNWYDITGGSISPNVGGFGTNVGQSAEQLLGIGHAMWYAPGPPGIATPDSTFTTQIGNFQSILGQGVTSIGYANNVGFDTTSPIFDQIGGASPPGATENEDSVLVGDFIQSYGSYNVTIGTESITGLTGVWSPDPGPLGRAINSSVTIGRQAVAEQPRSVVIGDNAYATSAAPFNYAGGCVSIGSNAEAQQDNTMAIGDSASVGGQYSIAIGNNSQIDVAGQQSIAIGYGSQVIAVESAIHIGTNAGAAIGTGQNAVGIGTNVDAVGDNSIAIGAVATSTAANQVMLGYGAGLTITLPDVFAVAETGFYTVNLVGRTQSGVVGNDSSITVAGSLLISGGIDSSKPYTGSELTLQYSQTRFTGQTIIADSEIVNGGGAFSIDLNAGDIYTIFGNDQATITLDYPTNIGPGTTIIKFKQGAAVPSTLVLNNAPCAPTPCGEWKFSGGGAPIGLTFAVDAEDILTIVKIYNTAIGGYDLYCSMLNDFQP